MNKSVTAVFDHERNHRRNKSFVERQSNSFHDNVENTNLSVNVECHGNALIDVHQYLLCRDGDMHVIEKRCRENGNALCIAYYSSTDKLVWGYEEPMPTTAMAETSTASTATRLSLGTF